MAFSGLFQSLDFAKTKPSMFRPLCSHHPPLQAWLTASPGWAV